MSWHFVKLISSCFMSKDGQARFNRCSTVCEWEKKIYKSISPLYIIEYNVLQELIKKIPNFENLSWSFHRLWRIRSPTKIRNTFFYGTSTRFRVMASSLPGFRKSWVTLRIQNLNKNPVKEIIAINLTEFCFS